MSSGLLTIPQAAERYQRKEATLREFIRRRSWLLEEGKGVLRFGRSFLIDPVKFEASLRRLSLQQRTTRRLRRVG